VVQVGIKAGNARREESSDDWFELSWKLAVQAMLDYLLDVDL
jgi:hypothetical protein